MNIMQGAAPSLDSLPPLPGKREILARALVEAMVDHDASARPSAKVVLGHAFFSLSLER